MFASVAYSDGKKAIVPTDSIKNFNPQNYEQKQKYKVLWADDGYYYDGVVLFVKETKEEAEKEMQERRVGVPNFAYCKSAVDLGEFFDQENEKPQHSKAATKVVATKIEETVNMKIAAVARRKNVQALKKKAGDVLDAAPPPKKLVKEIPSNMINSISKIKSTERVSKTGEKTPKTVEKGPQATEKIPETTEDATKTREKTPKTTEKRPQTTEKRPKTAENATKTGAKRLKITNVVPVKSTIKIVNKRSEDGKSTTTATSLIAGGKLADSDNNHVDGPKAQSLQGTNENNIEPSADKIANLTKEIKHLKEINSVLKKETQQQKKIIQEQKVEVENLNALNSDALRSCADLNEGVIAHFDQLFEIVRDLKQKGEETFSRDGGFPPVGYENKSTEQTHIGNGIYLPTCQFVSVMTNSRPKLFVKEMARAVFGKKTLLESTVTGKESNRTKKNRTNSNKPPPKQLNPTRMSCIRACLEFFLQDKRFQKKGVVMKETHIYNVGNYVGEYISDLKKQARKEDDPQPLSPAAGQYTDEEEDQEGRDNDEKNEEEKKEEEVNDRHIEPYQSDREDDDNGEEIEGNIEESEENIDAVYEHEGGDLQAEQLGNDNKSEQDEEVASVKDGSD